MPRAKVPICPRCGKPKAPGRSYCRDCDKALMAEWQRVRIQRSREAQTALDAPVGAPNRGDADKDDPHEEMIYECLRRGYDPDRMIALANVLPGVVFRKDQYGIWHPVGYVSDKKPDDESRPHTTHKTLL